MKLRWGVIGCSDFAARRSIPAMRAATLVDLVAIASRTSDKAKQFASHFGIERSYTGYDALLDDPEIDAVHIILPNSMHFEWTLRALEKGKHVLCEKPLAMPSDDVTQIKDVLRNVNAARPQALQVSEAFMWRYHPQHQMAMQNILQGVIGEIRLIRAAFTYTAHGDSTNIRFNMELGGGSLLDVGCYPISAARFYLGAEPEVVTATARFSKEFGVDTEALVIMTFPGNNGAMLDFGFEAPYRADLEIVGSRGRIYIPRAWQPEEQATIFVNERAEVLPPINHYVLMFDSISRSLIDGEPLEYNIEDAEKQARALAMVRQAMG